MISKLATFACFFLTAEIAMASFLHEGVYEGLRADHLRWLIQENDIDEKDEVDLTALHAAVLTDNVEACQFLLESGANYEITDQNAHTPLILSVRHNKPKILKLLLKIGANANVRIGHTRETVLHVAARNNYVEIFKILLHDANLHVNDVDREGWTALMMAAEYGHADIVRIHPRVDTLINLDDMNGLTALHRAVIRGHFDVVLALMDFPQFINEKDNFGLTAMHYAARHGHKKILVTLFQRGGDLEMTDVYGNTVLLNAVTTPFDYSDGETHAKFCQRSADIVKAILTLRHMGFLIDYANGSLIITQGSTTDVNFAGRSAEQVARANRNYEAYSILKQHRMSHSLDLASTVLPSVHFEVMYGKGNIEHVRKLLLIEDPNKKNYLGRTSLHIVASKNKSSVKIAREIINAGGDPTLTDTLDNVPLHLVVSPEMALLLLKANPDTANVPNSVGNLPIHNACENNRLDVVRVLAPYTANIDAVNNRDRSALSVAASKGYLDILNYLLRHGAGLIQAQEKPSPLHFSVISGATECTKMLLDALPDLLYAKNIMGNTPADILFVHPNPDVKATSFEAMSLTGADIPKPYLKNALGYLSPSFATFLNGLQAPVTFEEYLKRGRRDFTEDRINGIVGPDKIQAKSLGTFYSVAAAYYPQLAPLEVRQGKAYSLNRTREKYRRAVETYETARDRVYYVKQLRLAVVDEFMKEGYKFMEGTYMNSLPVELIEDVLVGVVNRARILQRIELLANALMLLCNDRRELESYREYLNKEIIPLSKLIIRTWPIRGTPSEFSFRRRSPPGL